MKIVPDKVVGYRCAQFHQITELYAGVKGNTTYDKASQSTSDNTILIIAIIIIAFFAGLIAVIFFMKARTNTRLNKAYQHADDKLADQPASIDERRSKAFLKERAKDEKESKKRALLWEKKSKIIKQKIKDKKADFQRRMKAIRRENEKRGKVMKMKMKRDQAVLRRQAKEQAKAIEDAKKRMAQNAEANMNCETKMLNNKMKAIRAKLEAREAAQKAKDVAKAPPEKGAGDDENLTS